MTRELLQQGLLLRKGLLLCLLERFLFEHICGGGHVWSAERVWEVGEVGGEEVS